ncbi:signal recognition particle-docking protein FtsY [Azospirillum doebereinerae]|uniref:signal recognition particle-docking protein FtsY n=1 Tax=Azospirillum doebereinerae TaxID=92933 RepID=UPI00163CAB51|nr:signal recognition particle-docking protein FtsY [Azospirillum doebereinerae]
MILRWFGRKKPEEDSRQDEALNPAPQPSPEPDALTPQPEPDAEPPAADPASPEEPVKKGWFSRFTEGLTKTEEPRKEDALPPETEPAPVPPETAAPAPDPVIPEPTPEPPPVAEPAGEPIATLEPEPEAEDAEPLPALEEAPPTKKGWFSRLKEGLAKSSSKLTDGITGIFTKRKLDDEALEELEDLLITADLGPATAAKVTAELARTRFGKEVSPEEVKATLAAEVTKIVGPVAKPLVIDPALKPHVILVVGVNGTGKTTTIGKLARQFRAEGKTVMLAAGDTFRAAAVSQLKIWGERTGCPVVSRDTGADAAGLAYDAVERARAEAVDVLLIDTAGRLQNKAGLMDELRKIVRVIKKVDETAPHTTLLTLDATTGQNAHSQVEIFRDMVSVNGLILTKLDGSARGGVLVSLAEKFKLPVHAIGVGEGVYDLRPFDAEAFAKSLMGLETN